MNKRIGFCGRAVGVEPSPPARAECGGHPVGSASFSAELRQHPRPYPPPLARRVNKCKPAIENKSDFRA
eukprot:653583-Prorocentrum_minimum.AAC.1